MFLYLFICLFISLFPHLSFLPLLHPQPRAEKAYKQDTTIDDKTWEKHHLQIEKIINFVNEYQYSNPELVRLSVGLFPLVFLFFFFFFFSFFVVVVVVVVVVVIVIIIIIMFTN